MGTKVWAAPFCRTRDFYSVFSGGMSLDVLEHLVMDELYSPWLDGSLRSAPCKTISAKKKELCQTVKNATEGKSRI